MEEQEYSERTTFLSSFAAAAITSAGFFFFINAVFSMSVEEWLEAMATPEWFSWILAIAIFLVPFITGCVCGFKGVSLVKCFGLTFGIGFLALIVAFVIGFIAALLAVIFEDILPITMIISLIIAFTATPTIVIAIIE